MSEPKKGLGRGLSALLGEAPTPAPRSATLAGALPGRGGTRLRALVDVLDVLAGGRAVTPI